MGFKPIRQFEDVKRPGFWVWEFEASPAFLEAFIKVAGKGGKNNERFISVK